MVGPGGLSQAGWWEGDVLVVERKAETQLGALGNWLEKFSRIRIIVYGNCKTLHLTVPRNLYKPLDTCRARQLVAEIRFSSDQTYDLGKHINIL